MLVVESCVLAPTVLTRARIHAHKHTGFMQYLPSLRELDFRGSRNLASVTLPINGIPQRGSFGCCLRSFPCLVYACVFVGVSVSVCLLCLSCIGTHGFVRTHVRGFSAAF